MFLLHIVRKVKNPIYEAYFINVNVKSNIKIK